MHVRSANYLFESRQYKKAKADIQQYLKDNRIQVVEVVKGGEIVKKDEAKLAEIESQIKTENLYVEKEVLQPGDEGYVEPTEG